MTTTKQEIAVPSSITKQVNDEYAAAERASHKAIGHYIECGRLLAQVRENLPGDLQFGKWRQANTKISKVWARKLVRVYETYGEKPPADLPISTLAELTYIEDPDKRKEVEEKKPSVREAKKAAKEERESHDVPFDPPGREILTNKDKEPEPKVEDKDTTEYHMLTLTADEVLQVVVALRETGNETLAAQIEEDLD